MRRSQIIPELLADQLDRLRGRLRAVSVASGVGSTLFLAVIALAAALAADLLVDLPTAGRVSLLAGVVGVVAIAFVWTTVWPLLRPLDDEELAALVEAAHPELNEQLLSAVEFSQNADDPCQGSPLMRRWLVSQTVDFAGRTDFADAVDAAPAVRRCWLGGGAVLALLLPLLFASQSYGMLLSRFLNPWGNLERVQNLILLVDEGDKLVGRGDDVTLRARIGWRVSEGVRPESGWLTWTSDDGRTQGRRLDWDAETLSFTAVLPRVERGFVYDLSAGGARTRQYRVEVVDRPELAGLHLEIVPPAYTGAPARFHDALLGEIETIEQSALNWTAQFTQPLKAAELVWLDVGPLRHADRPEFLPDGTPIAGRTPFVLAPDGRAGALDFRAALDGYSGRFRLRLVGAHGLANREATAHRLTIQPDQPPEIQFADGEQEAQARPDDVIEIPLIAADDFGVAALELHCEMFRAGVASEQRVLQAPRDQLPRSALLHAFPLDIAAWNLPSGTQISIRGRALDERPVPMPNESWTAPRVIQIRHDARPYGEQTLADRQQQTAEALAQLKQELERQAEQARQLQAHAQTDNARQRDWQHAAEAAELTERLERAREELERLAAHLAEQPLLGPLSEDLRQIDEQSLEPARDRMESAAQAPLPNKSEQFQQSADQLGQAGERLDQLQQDFERISQLQQDLLELNRLAANTERLADRVESLVQQQPEPTDDAAVEERHRRRWDRDHEELTQQHEQLEHRLERLLHRQPELQAAARGSVAQQLADLAERSRELAQRQAELTGEPTTDSQPAAQPTGAQPTGAQPTGEQPTGEQPTGEQAAGEQAAGEQAAGEQRPAGDVPANAEQPQAGPPQPADGISAPHDSAVPAAPAPTEADPPADRSEAASDSPATTDPATTAPAAVDPPSPSPAASGAAQPPSDAVPPESANVPEDSAPQSRPENSSSEDAAPLRAPDDPSPQAEAADGNATQQELRKLADQIARELQQRADELNTPVMNACEAGGAARNAADAVRAACRSMQGSSDGGPPQDAHTSAAAGQRAVTELRTAAQLADSAAGSTGRPPNASPAAPAPANPEATIDGNPTAPVAEASAPAPTGADASTTASAVRRIIPQQAGGQVAQAARHLAEAGDLLAQLGPPLPRGDDGPPAEPAETGEPSEEPDAPRGESDGAGDSPGNSSEALRAAAQSLRQLASQLDVSHSSRPGQGHQPGDSDAQQRGDETLFGNEQLMEGGDANAALGKVTERQWGKLPGRMQTDLLQSTQRQPDGEYAGLIRRYFEEISRQRSPQLDAEQRPEPNR